MRSWWIGSSPVRSKRSIVSNYLSVSCPNSKKSLFRSNSSTSGISTRTKPVILRSSSSSSSDAWVSHPISSLSKDSIKESNIIRDNTSSQMMTKVIAALDDRINILIWVRNNDLEGTKELSAAKVKVVDELGKTHLNSSWLIWSIDIRNVVLDWKRFSSKKNLRSRDTCTLVNMLLNSFVIPSNNWSASQIIKLTFFG